jgi:hypothetical protein
MEEQKMSKQQNLENKGLVRKSLDWLTGDKNKKQANVEGDQNEHSDT